MTCIRHHTTLDGAGRLLAAQRERHFKGAAEMAELFADLPEALDGACELSQRLDFTLADLGYQFPDYPLPPGETPVLVPAPDHLERRARPLPAADDEGPGPDREGARDDREARSRRLLPDRLGHRALLPARTHPRAGPRLGRQQRRLLRALDHGGRSREDGAALRALPLGGARRVAGHRPRPALRRPAREGHPARLREVRAARRGHDRERHHVPRPLLGARGRQGPRLLARAGRRALEAARRLELRRDPGSARRSWRGRSRAAGLDPEERRARHFLRLFLQIQNLPRHLGQHSGGIVVAAGRLDEVVPLEPASMPGRVVVQWDKDDCADLGIVKVDLLGLGHARRDRGSDPDDPDAREDGGRSRAPAPGRSRGLQDAQRRRHGRPLPGREPRADGVAAAQRAEVLLRHRRPGRDHPARADRRRHGAAVLRAAAGEGAGRVSASLPRADPEAHARRAALPGADPAAWRWSRRASPAARPRSCGGRWGSSARSSGWTRSRRACAQGMDERGIGAGGAGPDRQVDHLLRALRLPGVARGELRADRVRERVPEGAPSGGVPGVAAQRVADGLLPSRHAREGRAAPRDGSAGPST